ncbi:MAG: PilT/PilU family type 4a pilus ATPase [Verrucomicrobia bacterium]|nr:PilT/PilU family type 4a pilus ATPase [Verrucomicrobiota bacterium]MCG2678812.1 PilT/PilU family type 4a pilus ATPase [Kiritimatiellia bacterium]MBU4248672.1 PilT/PilU family type 4a pilus ATPase [Verrucomicrobiota bacterium]MBU4289697.1 PilT/PilU family type 4a pilus ATPase [Verrucomicrobiota bacterium]MBU4429331.1 PilT/PilU family type 4a pilus ATPase [Verrucomicrobiota bacterium]
MSVIKEVLQKAVSLDASDIHIKLDEPPFFRIHGDLVESGFPKMGADELKCIVVDILPDHIKKKNEPDHEMDFSHYEDGVGRFRVNVFLSHHVPTLAFRYVKTQIPTLADLHLPAFLKTFVGINSGIIMVCGATSSGKSTTLAALIDCINQALRYRIITIEDPVEYIFKDIKSVITQREVGLDTPSFHSALKHVMRQDPDVIMIGEMRDQISLSVALSAAETGHVVLSTLHSNTADQSIHRILSFYPAEEREQMRLAIAANLTAILCQRLVPAIRGGVLPAMEIMTNTPTVHKLLLGNKLDTLRAAIETGQEDGMQTFNQSLYKLIKSGQITEKDGLAQSPSPEALKMNLQGIFLDEGRRILGE